MSACHSETRNFPTTLRKFNI